MGGTLVRPHWRTSRAECCGEPCIALEDARAYSSNPYATSARYHREVERDLADDYDVLGSPLGSGMSGTVVLATGRLDGQKYAVKRFLKQGMSAKDMKLVQKEIEIYLTVDHPNVAKLVDVYEASEQLVLVMECCGGGELFDRVLQRDRLAECNAAAATRHMLRAVGYLHAHNIIHRDLKLENFLYQSKEANAPLKLIDFGLAKVWSFMSPTMYTCCGSISYVSPDMLSGKGYTSKCDLWSVGVIVFVLLSGYMPFSGDSGAKKAQIQAGQIQWRCMETTRHRISAQAIDFVRALLAFDPKRRLDANMALAHPWMARLPTPEVRLTKQVVLSIREYAGASKLRRAALQLLARELLPEESRELSELFLGLDKSNSGTVSVGELADALRELRKVADRSFWSYFSRWSTLEKPGHRSPGSVTTADTDSQERSSVLSASTSHLDGADSEEWQSPRSMDSPTPVDADLAEAGELFRVLDVNEDGEVYCSDFIAAALGSRPQLREHALQRVFARLDADCSGSVGPEDLRRVLGGPFEGAEPKELLVSSGALLDACGEVSPEVLLQVCGGGVVGALGPAAGGPPAVPHARSAERHVPPPGRLARRPRAASV